MVVLLEEFHGGLAATLKRKGAGEPELFDDDRTGFLPSCRATKMRRLVCPDGLDLQDDAAPGTGGQRDVPMGGEDLAPTPRAEGGEEDERAVVLYGGCDGDGTADDQNLRPWVSLRAPYWVGDMLREADSRTVRELTSGAHEQDAAERSLAVVPWVAPAQEEPEPSAEASCCAESDGEESMDMDVDQDEDHGHLWTQQAYGRAGALWAHRWPQHCMAPPPLPVLSQATPVMWSC